MAKKFNPDKQGKFPESGLDQDYSRLLISLNQTQLNKQNPALYQTIALLIRNIPLTADKIWKYIDELEELIGSIPTNDASGYWTPLTDGDIEEAHIIFANGEAIAVNVPVP